MRIVVIASCLLAGCAGAPAEKQPISTIGIDPMVIPAVPEVGGPVAAYAGFDNRGSEDHLLGIDCTCAASVELHQVIRNGAQVSMTNTFPLALPTGRTEVKPPGVPLHFMLIGTNRAFAVGERVPMRLRFERAGVVDVVFTVAEDSKGGWERWRPD